MKSLIILTLFLGHLKITSYRAVPAQTDSTPFYTSTGERVGAGGVAISRDLLCGACKKAHTRCREASKLEALIHYGDWLYVDGYGFRRVNDVMGEYSSARVEGRIKRFLIRKQIDIFVSSYEEEKIVNVKKRAVFKTIPKGE